MPRTLTLSLAALAAVALVMFGWSYLDRPAAPAARSGLSGEARAAFIRAANDACVTAQTGAPENVSLKPEAIARFCRCYGETLADAMSPADIERLAKLSREEIVAAQEENAGEAFQSCSEQVERDAGRPTEAR
ncbi:hypothetical protein [Methylopila turkensis]|uniref:Uncharacterized protein n=1 Tax=Methylopila turkensis TaxID=1437816 RepID=A0A9W6JJ45_9HYPH|nr:hypothetical protein [Methylopila turkensis]GLK78616.1 hypothetical protein GCM10008174_03570 [Methylopila turkensis]